MCASSLCAYSLFFCEYFRFLEQKGSLLLHPPCEQKSFLVPLKIRYTPRAFQNLSIRHVAFRRQHAGSYLVASVSPRAYGREADEMSKKIWMNEEPSPLTGALIGVMRGIFAPLSPFDVSAFRRRGSALWFRWGD
ncbi:hypothetical protein Dimus_016429 [Dionaea muscipula]